MRKPSEKTAKIKAALARGVPASEVAKKYGVSSSYVYAVRKRMLSSPVKQKKRPHTVPPIDVPTVPVQGELPRTQKERTFWGQLFNVFRRK